MIHFTPLEENVMFPAIPVNMGCHGNQLHCRRDLTVVLFVRLIVSPHIHVVLHPDHQSYTSVFARRLKWGTKYNTDRWVKTHAATPWTVQERVSSAFDSMTDVGHTMQFSVVSAYHCVFAIVIWAVSTDYVSGRLCALIMLSSH